MMDHITSLLCIPFHGTSSSSCMCCTLSVPSQHIWLHTQPASCTSCNKQTVWQAQAVGFTADAHVPTTRLATTLGCHHVHTVWSWSFQNLTSHLHVTKCYLVFSSPHAGGCCGRARSQSRSWRMRTACPSPPNQARSVVGGQQVGVTAVGKVLSANGVGRFVPQVCKPSLARVV
jgi:hypothetical protein